MITYFPTLYEDELLYSWFARYHLHSSNISPKQTMRDLYGVSNMVAVPDLPTGLAKIHDKIQHFGVPNVQSWIENHTFYRYYTSFLPKSKKNQVYSAMAQGMSSKSIHMSTGVMASSIKDIAYFRLCQSCIREDLENKGETYWRLAHQLPGVFVCCKHSEMLVSSDVPFRGDNKHQFSGVNLTNYFPLVNKTINPKTEYFLNLLAIQSLELINKDFQFTLKGIQAGYRYLLQKQSFANFKGTVDQEKLAKQFILYYGHEFLELVQSKVEPSDESCWLKSITRKHRKAFHPIRHLLFINFVGETINSFYQFSNEKFLPFGESPYYCLNSAAEHYQKRVISSVAITICTDTRRPVGTFECSCGFIYSRRGPDVDSEDTFKIGRVKQFGQLWFDKLQELVSQGLSNYDISRKLNCDIGTVKKYRNQKQIVQCTDCNKETQQATDYRKVWLTLIETHPNKSVTQLRNSNNNAYSWLYRNDKKWLQEHSPKLKRTSPAVKVNWNDRDEDILSEVKAAIALLKNREKPVFINRSQVGKSIGQLGIIEKHLNKFPKTKAYLDIHLESRESFQLRRVKWACQELLIRNECIVEWKIARLAGLKQMNEEFKLTIQKQALLQQESLYKRK
ncbi:TnsD family transposase [Halalkalibacter sp. AB-rgal2]|uniref:TnsD family transposase n=1 Tax=Halalkalibacter sp. AB-rgal2 TaxID=3242695 RepID=UPI00359DB551